MNRRVAVTGIGVYCACGSNTGEFWRSMVAGCSGIKPLTGFPKLRMPSAARVTADTASYFSEKELDLIDPFAQYALIAAREAAAGMEWPEDLKPRAGVITGSCVGGKSTEDNAFRELYAEDRTRFHPMIIPRTMANSGASIITMEFGLRGPSFTLSTACSSSNHALAQACWYIRNGMLDLAIAGGSEAPFSLGHLKAWEGLRVVSPDTCRPFSKDRKGMILGEGAAMLVLEPMESARARGATVYAEIAGAGMSADAHHITQPTVDGAALAMRAALQDAGLAPEQIGYINAHGTATQTNDPTECRAVRKVFGAHAERLAISSTKSMHGHALGAAGALEAAATILALHHQHVPPTANYLAPDPECDLDVVPNVSRVAAFEAALSNSFAFGGLNAVLVFRRC